MIYLLLFPALLLITFIVVLVVAGIQDLITYRKQRKDIFYQLSRDHNKRRRPAAK